MAQRAKSTSDGKGALIGAAVAGIAVGLVANLGRKAVVQGMTASAGNWSDGLKAEHAATLKIFDTLQETDDRQTAKRKTLLVQLKHALGKHAFEEENVVYPAMREHGLTEEADHLNHDHGYVKQFPVGPDSDRDLAPLRQSGNSVKDCILDQRLQHQVRQSQ